MTQAITPNMQSAETAGIAKHSKPETKKGILIRMLKRQNGATAASLCKTLSWQPHTLRAAVSGLRKTGFEVKLLEPTSKKGTRTYKIVSTSATKTEIG